MVNCFWILFSHLGCCYCMNAIKYIKWNKRKWIMWFVSILQRLRALFDLHAAVNYGKSTTSSSRQQKAWHETAKYTRDQIGFIFFFLQMTPSVRWNDLYFSFFLPLLSSLLLLLLLLFLVWFGLVSPPLFKAPLIHIRSLARSPSHRQQCSICWSRLFSSHL